MVIQRHELEGTASPEAAEGGKSPAASRSLKSRWQAFRGAAALYIVVALGTVIGGVLRAVASIAIHAPAAPGFPWGTLFVNVTGSFFVGFYAALTGPDGRLFVGPKQRHFVMTGICGGYTTFSIFSLETFRLLHVGDLPAAGTNVGVSVVGWLVAVWLGHIAATGLNRLKGA